MLNDSAYPVRRLLSAVILKVIVSNICGSDQHSESAPRLETRGRLKSCGPAAVVRGRTTAPSGLVLGHEITGVVEEIGDDVQFLKKGDVVSTPFNIACGRCANCVRGQTGICLTVNPARPGAAYGYVDSE